MWYSAAHAACQFSSFYSVFPSWDNAGAKESAVLNSLSSRSTTKRQSKNEQRRPGRELTLTGNRAACLPDSMCGVESRRFMAKVFITGSADGLGLMEARMLVSQGHKVVLHGRSRQRADEAHAKVPGALTAVAADLASIAETRSLADQVNDLGQFDAVIHNAGVYREPHCRRTIDGMPEVFVVNSLAPYILTCLMKRPKRLIYTSSGLHRVGDASLNDMEWKNRRCSVSSAYADSKLQIVILAFAVARKWRGVLSNAVDPGWAATKMGGAGAPVSVEEGSRTQVWLAVSQEKEVLVSGRYFQHQRPGSSHRAAADPAVQEKYLAECTRLSGVTFPA
jgi:NAD(P)-dependent dehydrogenase (short-subunit alcohol dehydrogenase family)